MRGEYQADFSDLQGKHALIALSGGADSTALAHMLAQARETQRIRLSAVHVHHGLRGADADADERFSGELCRRLDIPYTCVRIDVRGEMARTGEGTETAARRLRRAALEACADRLGADAIALAHHMDDQAETVLMHLMRGCGLRGIQGMRRWSGRLYRPLLDARHAELCAWLEARGLDWREDLTNRVPDNPRNALRLDVLGDMERIRPGSVQAIARFAALAADEDALLERETDRFLLEHGLQDVYGWRLAPPEQTEVAILRRAVLRLCGELPFERVQAAVELAGRARGRAELNRDWLAEKTGAHLYLLCRPQFRPESVPLNLDGTTSLERLGSMSAAPSAIEPVRDDPHIQVLDRNQLEGCVLRTRREGDRIAPLGCGSRLLSDVLTDRKIDRPLRDYIPLIARGSEILWAVGVTISEHAKLTGRTRSAVRLEWTPCPAKRGTR